MDPKDHLVHLPASVEKLFGMARREPFAYVYQNQKGILRFSDPRKL